MQSAGQLHRQRYPSPCHGVGLHASEQGGGVFFFCHGLAHLGLVTKLSTCRPSRYLGLHTI